MSPAKRARAERRRRRGWLFRARLRTVHGAAAWSRMSRQERERHVVAATFRDAYVDGPKSPLPRRIERMPLGDMLESVRQTNDWFAKMVGLRPDGAGGYEFAPQEASEE